ncbi:MAG: hypothetical protein PF486_06145 [Prolixibacteraceae bacterium]|jgi:hypothetical protein|nr:hypothetical protein [Prolixibacteraceae bacterium]
MKDISTVTGIEVDADFPTGYKIVDGQTYVNATLYQDLVQTFQKLIDLARITPNGLFDNEVNGYQLLDGLKSYIDKEVVVPRVGTVGKAIIPINGWDMSTSLEFFIDYPDGFKDKITPYGVTSISAVIRKDLDNSFYNIEIAGGSDPAGFVYLFSGIDRIHLGIRSGSFFNSSDFSFASGFVTVEYLNPPF